MIGSLLSRFPNLQYICYFDADTKKVYLEGKEVTIDNSVVSGYVRRNNDQQLNEINASIGEYEVIEDLTFIGSVPFGLIENVTKAVKGSIISCDTIIKTVSTDKVAIAESEGLDLSKFTDVVLIKVDYEYKYIDIIDKCAELDMCKC